MYHSHRSFFLYVCSINTRIYEHLIRIKQIDTSKQKKKQMTKVHTTMVDRTAGQSKKTHTKRTSDGIIVKWVFRLIWLYSKYKCYRSHRHTVLYNKCMAKHLLHTSIGVSISNQFFVLPLLPLLQAWHGYLFLLISESDSLQSKSVFFFRNLILLFELCYLKSIDLHTYIHININKCYIVTINR